MKTEKVRKVDSLLKHYEETFGLPSNRLFHLFGIPFLAFGFLGLVWAIPVPEFEFLGRWNGYINVATFLILGAVFFYLRLNLRLALGIIFSIWIFSAGIITLERMHRLNSWPEMGWVCLVIFTLASLIMVVALQKNEVKMNWRAIWQVLVIGPVWFWAFLFRKFGWLY